MTVSAGLDRDRVAVEPGQEAALVLTVVNKDERILRFEVVPVGPSAPWVTPDPTEFRLKPEDQIEVRVAFRPPKASVPRAGVYPFGLSVRPASSPADWVTKEGKVTVGSFVELTSQILPVNSRGRLSGTHRLASANHGNSIAHLTVKASGGDQLLRFDVVPEVAEVVPDGKLSVRIRARPKNLIITGNQERKPFDVSLEEPLFGSRQFKPALEQRALLPGWWKTALGMVAAGVLLVAFLPKILEAAGITPTPSPSLTANASPSPEASPSTGQASESPSATPTATPEPTATSTPTPTPAPTQAAWALDKAHALEALGIAVGSATGTTLPTEDGLGFVQPFQQATIYMTPTGDVWAIRGGLNGAWRDLGGGTAVVPELGFPVADEDDHAFGGPVQQFDLGVLQCADICAYILPQPVYTWWLNVQNALGSPTKTAKVIDSNGSLGAEFQNGIIYIEPQSAFSIACLWNGRVIASNSGATDCAAPMAKVKNALG